MNKTDLLSGSHLPILIKLLSITYGPVLEMGMGLNSTPVLHWLCTAQKRPLLSLETDEKWYQSDLIYKNEYHKIELVKNWNEANIFSRYWSVVLIDHRPAKERRNSAVRLKDNADYIMLHDAEPEIETFYGYKKIIPKFEFSYLYDEVKPNTLVLSNTRSLSHLLT